MKNNHNTSDDKSPIKYMAFACDCDPDSEDPEGGLNFNGIKEGIPRFLKELAKVNETYGVNIPLTWNVRADFQIAKELGRASGCGEKFSDIWTRLLESNHEIAWHPHLWRLTGNGRWTQEWQDEQWIIDCLSTGHEGFCKAFNKAPAAVHMGWCFHNDISMTTLNRLAVKTDYSALPGMKCQGWELYPGVYTNKIDWLEASQTPYFPCAEDYKRSSRGSHENVLGILELPQSTVESCFFSMLYHLKKHLVLKINGRTNTDRACCTS